MKHLFCFSKVSRSIGDAYLKRSEFNREPLLAKFRVPEAFQTPILRAEPAISVHKIHPEDQFLIFASDGLWEHLSNQEAVDIVNTNPRNVRLFSLFLSLIFSYECRLKRIDAGNCEEADKNSSKRSSKEERDEIFRSKKD